MSQSPGDTREAVGSHYDQVTLAWIYLLGEDLHYGDFAGADEPLNVATARLTQRMAEAAALCPSLEVLDVGCGIGGPAVTLARRWGCRVTGITISEVGLELARRRAEEQGIADRVRFLHADGMDNGLPDASFDRAWVMESSHLMADRGALLAECAGAASRRDAGPVRRHRPLPVCRRRDHAARA